MSTFIIVSLTLALGMCIALAGKTIIYNGLMLFFALAQYIIWKWDQLMGKR